MNSVFVRVLVIATFLGSGTASAQSTRRVATPNLVSAAGIQMNQVIQEEVSNMNKQCIDQASDAVEKAAFGAKIQADQVVSQGEQSISGLENAKAAVVGGQLQTAGNLSAAELCEKSMNTCQKMTTFYAQSLRKTMVTAEQTQLVYKDLSALETLKGECYDVFAVRSRDSQSQAMAGFAAAMEAKKVRDAYMMGDGKDSVEKAGEWLANNWGKATLGVVAIGGGISYIDRRNDKKKEDAERAKVADEAKIAKDAANDPTCTSAVSFQYAHCQKYLKSLCARVGDMEDARCKSYSNNLCGFSQAEIPLSAAATALTGAGVGTQLCQDTLAQRYCQGANRQACYSCLEMRDKATATCMNNPAACVREHTDNEMAQFKGKCSDDPVFTLPKWAHIKAPETTTTASVKSQSIIGDRSTASVSTSFGSDVGAASSPNVSSQSSLVVKQLCAGGSLNCAKN